MVVLDKDDVVRGIITFPKENIPKAEFFIKKTITVVEDDEISITGNYTTEGGTSDEVVFAGRIDDVDLSDVQKVKVISKAEEINTIRPNEKYYGYTETILGNLINNYCNEITCAKTQTTLTLRPDADIVVGAWDDPAPGNNNNIMFDDINEAGAANGEYIKSNSGGMLELTFSDHGLSSDFHYFIYRIDLKITAKCSAGTYNLGYNFKDPRISWRGAESISLDTNWTTYTTTYTEDFSGIEGWTEDGLNDIRLRMEVFYDTGQYAFVDKVEVIIYYNYFPNLEKGSYKSSQNYAGERTLRRIFDWAILQELFTWYLNPALEFYFNAGDVDSGVDISNTDKIGKIKGKKQVKNFDKVELLGGISELTGNQITASAGAGNIIFKDTYVNIRDTVILGNLASQILSNKGTYPLTVKLFRFDSTKGMIQPGEEVTINADIHYSGSSRTITAGQYKIDKIKYYIKNGIYEKVDLTISDGLVFIKKKKVDITDENSALITQLTPGGGAGGPGISDEPYDQTWDEDGDAATKNVIYDKIEELLNSSLGLTLFLHQDVSADVGGYKLLTETFPDDAKTEVFNVTITTDDQEIEQWVTPSGGLGLQFLLHGIYQLHLHAYRFSGTKNVRLYFKVYKRASGGTETLLGTSHESTILAGAEEQLDLHVEIHEQSLLITDRIVLKIFASLEGAGNNPVVYFYVEGDTLVRFLVPANIGSVSLNSAFNVGKIISGANSEANAFGVGDGTDLLKFYTSAGVPRMKVIGSYGMHFESNDGTWVVISIQEDGANYFDLLWNKAGSYGGMESSGPIRIMPSGITADYLDFYTSGGVPRMKVIGGGWYYLETDNATWVGFQLHEDASNFLNFYWNKTSNYGRIKSSGPLRLSTNNDDDDYIEITTTANVPKISFVGGNGLITNVADPINAQDVATRDWVQGISIL
ncbi:hypothetical protein LCGC14_1114840 [marine sediment metagenome]|uniref:CBM-cenC domain-containing protein n=1 Tax=marine sediment metagenome TaxID=412755 RepID=A0A0F9PNQ5_9ZZZZ